MEKALHKVMVVDDNMQNRFLIIETINDIAECEVAENGREAFKLYSKSLDDGEFDLILLDIAMPEIDGIQLLKLIREQEDFSNVPTEKRLPIIMVTAHEDRLKEAFNLGCHDFILKPINPDHLLDKTAEILGVNL